MKLRQFNQCLLKQAYIKSLAIQNDLPNLDLKHNSQCKATFQMSSGVFEKIVFVCI